MAANRRKKDFEEKLKLWEKRASAEFSDLPDHHRPLPNFKGLHAAQKAELENMEKRRKEKKEKHSKVEEAPEDVAMGVDEPGMFVNISPLLIAYTRFESRRSILV